LKAMMNVGQKDAGAAEDRSGAGATVGGRVRFAFFAGGASLQPGCGQRGDEAYGGRRRRPRPR
jgi:hypothetical protein